MCWLILWDKISSSLSVWKTYLLPTIKRKDNLHHLRVEDMAWILKSTMPHSTPKWKISPFTTYCRSIVVCITTRIDKSLLFWERFWNKSLRGKNGLKWDWLTFGLLIKKVKVLLNWLGFIYENVLKCMDIIPSLLWKCFKFQNKKSFQKGGEDFWN